MGENKFSTRSGHNAFECMSALQKEVRRGKELEAIYWAIELQESGFSDWVVSRLRVISHEDVGLGDINAVMFASKCLDDFNMWYPKNGAYLLALCNAVMVLCRARKSRDADNVQAVVRYNRAKGKKLGVPDYAFCKHTYRGKRMGRGFEHFFTEGAKLEPDVSTPDYAETAKRAYCEMERGECPDFTKSPTPCKGVKDDDVADSPRQEEMAI